MSLCLASKSSKKIVDRMDSSCWRKQAQKLEAVLRLEATGSTPHKERYLLLKPEVERLANRIRERIEKKGIIKVEPDFFETNIVRDEDRAYLMSGLMSLQELATTASLVHYDMIGEVNIKYFHLMSGHLSFIPSEQLGSLASCVTNIVSINPWGLAGLDLGVLLDKIKSKHLSIANQSYEILGTDDLLALVRALQTRVKTVEFQYTHTVDIKGSLKK